MRCRMQTTLGHRHQSQRASLCEHRLRFCGFAADASCSEDQMHGFGNRAHGKLCAGYSRDVRLRRVCALPSPRRAAHARWEMFVGRLGCAVLRLLFELLHIAARPSFCTVRLGRALFEPISTAHSLASGPIIRDRQDWRAYRLWVMAQQPIAVRALAYLELDPPPP